VNPFDKETAIDEVWKGISELEKNMANIHASCESEKEDLWKAMLTLEKNLLSFKEEVTDRLILLHKEISKKLS